MIPIALPLWPSENTEVTMATPVLKIIELPTPCKTLEAISISDEDEIPQKKEKRVKTIIPNVRILLRPYISALRPKGTRNMAPARMYELETQLSKTASIENSRPMAGRAMFTEEPIKGVRKEPVVVTRSTAF